MKIKFPRIEEESAQICFVKRHRQKGETKYIFYNVNIHTDVSNKLKTWLSNNVNNFRNMELREYNPSLDDNNQEVIDLSKKVDKWPIFAESAFNINPVQINDLNDIRRSLTGFIIYVKSNGYTIGQIRKIFPKSILSKKGIYKVFFRNGTFNEIKEDIGLQVDDKADLIFMQSDDTSQGVVINKENFKLIFDMREQEKKEAITIFENLKLLSRSKHSAEIRNLVKNDRQIQKMLINPALQQYMDSVNYEILKKLKQKVGDKIAYELDDVNRDFILPESQKKKALKDIIKTMCGRYNQDLKGDHIMESTNIKRLLK